MKRITAFILALTMLLGIFPAGVYADQTDIEVVTEFVNESESSVEDILTQTQLLASSVQDSGLSEMSIDGASARTLTGGTVTRAQWINEMVALFSLEATEEEMPDNYYADIAAESEYFKAIQVATLWGLIDTPPGENFGPDAPATREFVSHTLNHMLGYHVNENASYTFAESATVTYPSDIQAAIDQGWFGLSGSNFMPQQAVTADEANKIIAAVSETLEEDEIETGNTDKIEFNSDVMLLENYTAVTELERTESGDVITGTLEFTDLYEPEKIKEGQKIAVYIISIPSIYKVSTVSTTENITTITGTAIPLMQAVNVETLSMEGETEVGLEYFHEDEDSETVYVFDDGVETQSATYARMRAIKDKVKINDVKKTKKVNIIPGVDAKVTAKLSKLSIEYNISMKKVQVKVKGDIEGSVGVEVDALEMMGVPKSFLIAGADIPGIGGIGIYVVIGLDGSLTYTIKTDFNAEVIATTKSLRVPFNVSKPKAYLTAEVNAKAGFRAEVKISLLECVKGNVFTEVGLRAQYYYKDRETPNEYNVSNCENYERYAYAQAGYSLNVGFKVVGFDVKAYSKSETLDLISKNDKICYDMWHREDGIQRTKCSFGDSGKYYTPTTSRNYYHNFYNTSSKAYNGGSQPVQIYTYTLDESNRATITGCNFATSSMAIPKKIDGYDVVAIGNNAFKGKTAITVLNIPEGITYIGNNAFDGCKNIRDINFPSTLREIGRYAFHDCDALISLELPEGLTRLWNMSFADIYSLKRVYIPKSLTQVHLYSGVAGPFAGCDRLEEVIFADGVTTIPYALFSCCGGLKKINIPSTVTTIEGRAFNSCVNLSEVNFSPNITYIGDYAFAECSALTEVTLPHALTGIGNSAFNSCRMLENVNFNEGLLQIGYYAFNECAGLKEVILPKSLTMLRNYTFGNCDSLTKVFIPKSLVDVSLYTGIAGPFAECDNLTDVEFEEGITTIPYALFSCCGGLKKIDIPSTVTTLSARAFCNCDDLATVNFSQNITYIGAYAFEDCAELTEITLPAALTKIDNSAFQKCPMLEKVNFNDRLLHIGYYAFNECASLKEVILPKSLTMLRNYTFGNCDSLTKVFIPKSLVDVSLYTGIAGPFSESSNILTVEFEEGVSVIPYALFSHCDSAFDIAIPDTVKTIANRAFMNANRMKSVTFGSASQLEVIGEEAFRQCASLTVFKVPAGVKTLGKTTFMESSSVTEVSFLGNNITSIPQSAFEKCGKLTKVNIPGRVDSIGVSAFGYCTSLPEITLPDGIKTIGAYAFRDCTSLQKINIPAALTVMENLIFYNCDSLAEMIIPEGITYVKESVFEECDGLVKVVVPESVISIGKNSFRGCDKLKDITLGKGITVITAETFKDDPAIENIVIPKGVVTIEKAAFKNDTSLVSVTIPQTVTNIGSEAFSYNDLMTIYGCKGSYAETWAGQMGFKFVDITNNLTSFAVVDENEDIIEEITLYKGEYYTPEFLTIAQDDTKEYTDHFTYSFSSNAAAVSGNRIYAKNTGSAVVTVTAVTADGTSKTEPYQFTINVIDLTKLIVTPPTKTSYSFGEALDPAGMVVKAVYTDNSEREVTGYEVTGYDPEKYGKQTVTIIYAGKKATFTVEVIDDRILVESIEVTTPPAKTEYLIKENLDTTGIVVTATYSDGTKAEVPADKLDFSGVNVLVSGDKTVTVTYKGENIRDKAPTATFMVTYYKETPTEEGKVAEIISAINTVCAADVTVADKEELLAIKAKYDSLSAEGKAKVTNYSTLEAALTKIANLEKVSEIEQDINDLYREFAISKDNVSYESLMAVKEQAELLDAAYQAKIPNIDLLDKMLDAFEEELPDVTNGDVNGDGGIDAKDATQILRYSNGKASAIDNLSEAEKIAFADVNGDGSVDAKDATQILRFVNGKPSALDMKN